MKIKRKRRLLIDMEERQLVVNSKIIDEYPKLKSILEKYRRIDQKDILNDDFDDELKNLISFVFKDIKKEAEKEWYGTGSMETIDPPNPKNRIKCSLCGRRNIHIFYIKNRFNKKKINVGSDCIDKFPDIDTRLPEGMTAKEYKRKRIREYEKLKRLEDFNKKFPDAKEMLLNWSREYNNLPIILPMELHENIIMIHEKANTIFEGYISGKVSNKKLKDFENFIRQREKLMLEAKKFIDENKNNKFILTREIYDWITKGNIHNPDKLIEKIRNNSSTLNDDDIPLIYEEKFFEKMLEPFEKMLTGNRLSMINSDNNNIYFQFKDNKQRLKCKLYLTKKDFMQLYGKDLVKEDSKIEEKDLIEKADIAHSKENYLDILYEIEEILKGTSYKVDLDYDLVQPRLEFTNKKEKVFADKIVAEVFFRVHKKAILIKDENEKQNLYRAITRFNGWRPLSDKEKFATGSIDKKPDDKGYSAS